MDVAAQMLEARTDERGIDHATLALAIGALQDVVSATTACADTCLTGGADPDRADCIRACTDAADVAGVLSRVLARTGPTVRGSQALVSATSKLLSEAGSVAGRHGQVDKCCRIAAETMTRAQQALQSLETAIAAAEYAGGGTAAATADDRGGAQPT